MTLGLALCRNDAFPMRDEWGGASYAPPLFVGYRGSDRRPLMIAQHISRSTSVNGSPVVMTIA